MDELVDAYIDEHRDELTRDEFEAYCCCHLGREDLVSDINEFRGDDEQLSVSASDDDIYEAWLERFDIWEAYSDSDARKRISDLIQEELDEEFDRACKKLERELKKIADKYSLELEHEESHSWNPGIIRSQYFYFDDEDGYIWRHELCIRFGDAHDNGRNDCDFDLDFREIDEKLDEWLGDILGNLSTLLHL